MLSAQDDFTSILIRRKVLTPSQLHGAKLLQRSTNGPLRDVLVDFGYATKEQVRSALAVMDHPGRRRSIDLTDFVIHRSIVALLPESVAREHIVVPVALVNGVLLIAMADPTDDDLIAQLVLILNRDIETVAAPREQIVDCIDRHYGESGGETKDIFETDFDAAAVVYKEEFESLATELEEEDGDLESSDFDLALEDSSSRADDTVVVQARRTLLAMDDAARESSDTLCGASFSMGMPEAPKPAAAPAAAPAARSGERLMRISRPASLAEVMVERQATIRYYHRMSPERMFPMLVVISRKAIMEVVKKHVAQKQSKAFQVELDSTVEIEPILPGCDCFPPRETVKIAVAESTARFWIVPRVLGEVMHARVVVRQNGTVLAEVPLEVCVVKQTVTLVVGAMNFCVPFVSMLLKQSQMSLASSEAGAGLLAVIVGWVLLVLSPEVLAGLLLIATISLYLWLRPRQRDVFWDIQPVPSQGQAAGTT